MNKQILSALASAALLAISASAVQAQNIAIVNGKPIPTARADALAQQAEQAKRPIPKEQLRDIVVTREIFAQAAQAQGLDATEEFKSQMELARQQLLIQALIVDFQKNNTISDADAKAEYDKFAANNSGNKEYHAHHILVEKESQAKDLIAQLKKGAKFDTLAKKFSKDPGSGAKGGDLDWSPAGNYVKEFSDAMVALNKGAVTDKPVKSQFGYHIIRLDDVRESQMPAFEEIKPQIMQQLQAQKFSKFQEELRAKAKVE